MCQCKKNLSENNYVVLVQDNEVSIVFHDGSIGVAHCNPTDTFSFDT